MKLEDALKRLGEIVKTLEQTKTPAVDLLINNAGILKSDGPFERLDFESVLESFKVNTLGPMRLAKALLPLLSQSPKPIIVNITSQMGSIDDNKSGGYYSYRISKTALNMFNKSFSLDHPQITSVVVHPGWVQTRMGGAGATITPEVSVRGLFNLVKNLDRKSSGRFFNHRGEELPW